MKSLSKNFSLKEKLLLLLLAVIIIGAGYYFLVHQPVTEALDQCRAQTESLNTEIPILNAKRAKQVSMERELARIHAVDDSTYVPDYDNLESITYFLYEVLGNKEDYNLSVSGIQSSGSGDIVRRGMTIGFTCPDYASAKEAISKLQNSPYCCRLGAMSFTRNSSKVSRSVMEGAVSVSVNITFFEHKKG